MSSPQQLRFTQLSFVITCPRCQEHGVIVWEDAGGERTLVSLATEFYERISRKSPYGIELVCLKCGTIQQDTSNASPNAEFIADRAA